MNMGSPPFYPFGGMNYMGGMGMSRPYGLQPLPSLPSLPVQSLHPLSSFPFGRSGFN